MPGTACVVHLGRPYAHLGSDVCAGGSMGPAVASRVRARPGHVPVEEVCLPSAGGVHQG